MTQARTRQFQGSWACGVTQQIAAEFAPLIA